MLDTPFLFGPPITDVQYQTLGKLMVKWSTIDHVLANCLRAIMKQTEEEAVITIFPMSSAQRLDLIKKLRHIARPSGGQPLNSDAQAAIDALCFILPKLRAVRNNVAHAIPMRDGENDAAIILHNRARGRDQSITLDEVFSTEEVTNYAAHAVVSLRYAIGLAGADPQQRYPLPAQPALPPILQ